MFSLNTSNELEIIIILWRMKIVMMNNFSCIKSLANIKNIITFNGLHDHINIDGDM